jgi:voltage-gated potassium channel
MENIKKRLKIFLIIFCAIMILGPLGFMAVEGRSLLDSFYFVIVTMATVGYGDVHPVTAVGKIFSIALIVMGVGTFLGAIGNITEIMLTRRETESRLEKLNMVIGVFYSEVGLELLSRFSGYDPHFDAIRPDLLIKAKWADKDFIRVGKDSLHHQFQVDMVRVDLPSLKSLLLDKRNFLLRLLENPVLLEHQSFTDFLRAVFHLTEELTYRSGFNDLPKADIQHLATDIKRVYHPLVSEWIFYMKYLKNNYPFLFSLAIRTNPFDQAASVVIEGPIEALNN